MDNRVNQKLKQLREYAKENYIPVLKEETAEVLKEWLIKKQPKKILEIGTSIGTSGILALSVTNATLVTIEKDRDTLDEAINNFKEVDLFNRVEFINDDCFKALMFMSANYDFIVLDGPKGHNKELTELVFPLLQNKGIIFVDNIDFHNKVKADGFIPRKHRTIVRNMREFLNYINTNKNMKTTIYEKGDGIAVIEKTL